MSKEQENTDKVAEVKSAKTMSFKTPEVIEVHGEIVSVDTIKNRDNEELGILVSIFDVKTQKTFKAITSNGQLDAFTSNGGKYRDMVTQGKQYSAKLEVHEAGVTGYKNDEGVFLHKTSGFALNEILPLASFQTNYFNARTSEQVKIDMEKDNLQDRVNTRLSILKGLGYSHEAALDSVAKMMAL